MDGLIRDSLKDVMLHPIDPSMYRQYKLMCYTPVCLCFYFLSEFSQGRRELSDINLACHLINDGKTEHRCICKYDSIGPYFGVLLEACRAIKHRCICHGLVVPSPNMSQMIGTRGFITGRSVCLATEEHECICSRIGSDVCRRTEHKCSCDLPMNICKADGIKVLHKCQCQSEHGLYCKVHRPARP